eukprot:TRINITY_DN14209_c1_g2_i2.p1 TRINITY_DN14209_c1_g2~~TRINITY_DN14209_c1_g2_i2.p1  ORF type:complete len:1207 (+),score=282.21 TRINITY_DN14209_c1_g2_i2:251-3871(+)
MPPKGATGSASPGAAANDEDETSDVEIEFELPQGKVEEFLNQLQADKSDLKAAFPLAASAVIKAVEEDGKPVPAVLKDLPEAPADVVAKFDAVSRLSRLKELQNRYAGLNAQRERAEGMKRVLDRVPAAGEAEGSLGPPLGTTNMPLVPGLGAPDEAPPAFPPPGGLPFPYRGVPGVLPSKVREPPKPPADPTMGEELIDAPDPRLPPEAEDEPDSKLPEAKMVLLKDGLDMSFQHLRTHGQRMAATVRELSRQLEEGAELAEVMDLQADPDIVEEYVRNQRLIYEQQRVMDEADWDRRIEKERQFWVERDGRTVELRRFYGDDIRGKPDELGGPGAAGSLLAAAAAAAGGGGAEPALPQFGGGGGGAASGPSSPARGFDTRSPEGIRRHDFSACTRGDHGAFGYVNGEASGPGSPSSRYEEDLPPSLSYRRALRRVGNDGEWPGPEEIENVRGQDSYAYGQWEESGIGYAESESYHSELTAPGIEGGAFFAGFAERSAGSAQQQRLEALRRSKSAPRAFRTAQAPQEQDAPPFAAFNGYGTAPRRSASQHRGAASPRSAAAAAPSLSPRSLPKQRSAAPYAAEISQWERPPFAAFAGEQGTPPRARRGGTGSLGGTPSPGTGGHTPRSGGGPGAGSRRPQRPGSGTSTPGRGGSTGRNSFLFGVKPGPASSVGEEKTRLSTTRESAEDTEEGEEEEEEVGFLATLASAAGLGEGSEANGPPVSKAAKKRMKELDPKSRYVVGACLDSNLPLKPPDLKSIRAAAGHGVEVRFQRIVEVRHEGRMGDPSVAQLALDYSAALAQHGEEIAKAGDTTRHVSLVVDLLTFYPLSVQLHLWALEAMMALYNASEGGEAGADGLSNPIFDAVAEIVEIHEGDKGLGASCPELGNRLLAAMALVITPANRTRMENLHVDFVLRLTSFPDAGAGVMEHGLQVLIVSRSQHRLKEQLKFAQSTLAAFRAEPKLVTRVLLAMHAIWEVSCEGPYRLLMDVTGAAPLGGHTVSGMREVCRVMDLYAQDRKVQGAGCFALRAAVKVADKSREVTFRKLIEDGLLRAVNYAQMNFRSSRSVAVNMCTITLAVARKMSKLMNIETALQVIDAGSSHVRDAEACLESADWEARATRCAPLPELKKEPACLESADWEARATRCAPLPELKKEPVAWGVRVRTIIALWEYLQEFVRLIFKDQCSTGVRSGCDASPKAQTNRDA